MSRPQPQGWIKMFTSLACSIKLGEAKVGTEWCHWHVFHQLSLFQLYRANFVFAPSIFLAGPLARTFSKTLNCQGCQAFKGHRHGCYNPSKKTRRSLCCNKCLALQEEKWHECMCKGNWTCTAGCTVAPHVATRRIFLVMLEGPAQHLPWRPFALPTMSSN